MKIYLDIVYLLNTFIGFLCLLSMGVIFGKTFSFSRLIGLSMLWGMNVIGLYLPSDTLLTISLSILLSFFIDARQKLKMTLVWLFLSLTYTTSFMWFGDMVRKKGLILVVDTSFSWIYACILGTFVIGLYLMMLFSLKHRVIQQGLFYQVLIRKNNQTISLRGFMDTGNQAVMDGIPVLFIRDLEWEKEKEVVVDHVGGKNIYPAVRAEIYWNQTWHPIYLARMDHLVLEDATVLLNLQLF